MKPTEETRIISVRISAPHHRMMKELKNKHNYNVSQFIRSVIEPKIEQELKELKKLSNTKGD